MAVGQSLRYYRQQFSPEAAYQRQGGSGDIFSMYDPEGMARYISAVEKHQERYDTGAMAKAQEIARIGELETYDIQGLTNRLKAFESGINKIVKERYNGDYAAAASTIAMAIGTERTDPWYHFNKPKVEAVKAYDAAKASLGSNFMSARNPRDVSFEAWQQGETFDFTPVNREAIVKESMTEFGSIADTIMNDPTLRNTTDGRFVVSMIQYGVKDPAQLEQFMASQAGQAMISNIIDRNPELGKLPREQVMGAITEGAYSAIGKSTQQIMQNPDYLDAYQRAQIGDKTGQPVNAIVDAGIINTPQFAKEMKEERNNLSNAYKQEIMQEVLKQPKYASIRDIVKNYNDISAGVWGEIVGSVETMYAGPKVMEMLNRGKPQVPFSPVVAELVKELDARADTWFAGEETDQSGVPLGIHTYKLSDFPEVWTPAATTMRDKIENTFQRVLKPYVTGSKPSELVSYIGRQSKKNSAKMDATKDINVSNIAFDPYSPHILFAVTGVDSDGKTLESKVAINGGSNGIMSPDVRQLLGEYVNLGQNYPEFMENAYAWVKKFYPNDPMWNNQ